MREHGSTADVVSVHAETVPKLPGFGSAEDAATAATAGWSSQKGSNKVTGLGEQTVVRSDREHDLHTANLAVRRGNPVVAVSVERWSNGVTTAALRTQATKIARTVLQNNG